MTGKEQTHFSEASVNK